VVTIAFSRRGMWHMLYNEWKRKEG